MATLRAGRLRTRIVDIDVGHDDIGPTALASSAQLSSSAARMCSTAWEKRRILATAFGLKPTWAWKRWMRVLRLQERSRLRAPIERAP